MEEVAQSFVPAGLVVEFDDLTQLQASWYDPIVDRICFLDANGKGPHVAGRSSPLCWRLRAVAHRRRSSAAGLQRPACL